MIVDKTGALANVKRHDYAPFGEELFNGLRTTAMGYGAADSTKSSHRKSMTTKRVWISLRRVAENPMLNQQEKNIAFVLMQYFGYLRRNPNDPQDSDYSGYDFWLTKLNQFNGNFVNADMVQAFIDSGEYRGRFGP